MFNIGPEKFLILALVALVVLGPDKLPEAARTASKFLGELRRMSAGFEAQVRSALDTPPHTVDAVAPLTEVPTTSPIVPDEPQTEPADPDRRLA